jgi:Family of unknown function (DUF6535)
MKVFWNTRTQPQSSNDFVSVTARDSKEKMWSIYKEEANKYDGAVTEAQKEDADSVLVFVGYILPIVSSLGLTSSKDWSVLRSRRRVHCRKLQEAIP